MQGTLRGTKASRMPSVVSSLLFLDQRHRFDAIYCSARKIDHCQWNDKDSE